MEMKLGYAKESKAAIQGKSPKQGCDIKGCITRSRLMVKYKSVKLSQKAGRAPEKTVSFTKDPPKQKTVETAGKCRKKG